MSDTQYAVLIALAFGILIGYVLGIAHSRAHKGWRRGE